MTALVDSGFLYAIIDRSDTNHKRVTDLLPNLKEDLILVTTVLVEVTYLLQARLGHTQMRQFIQMLKDSPLQFESIDKSDLGRIFEILDQYADTKLDFVDASIVAMAERLNIQRILTVDQRDFSIIRPIHCEYFEILP